MDVSPHIYDFSRILLSNFFLVICYNVGLGFHKPVDFVVKFFKLYLCNKVIMSNKLFLRISA